MTAAAQREPRRTYQPVRRDSYDVGDRRAQVFRPIGDGTRKGAMRWRDKYLQVAEEYDLQNKKPGERHPLGGTALRVLKRLLWLPGLDFKTGRLEPAIATIQKLTGYARATIVAALRRLWNHGFLDWVRRTERTDHAPGEGPQVKQATNAYFFDLTRLCAAAAARLRELTRRPPVPDDVTWAREQDAAAKTAAVAEELGIKGALDRLEAALSSRQSASSEGGQNPSLGD